MRPFITQQFGHQAVDDHYEMVLNRNCSIANPARSLSRIDQRPISPQTPLNLPRSQCLQWF
jgi:hypothetical protein